MSNHLTSTFISNIKKSAKTLKKELGISHSKSLELAAKDAGYDSYHALQARFKNQSKSPANYTDFARQFLIQFVKSEVGIAGIEQGRSIVERYHSQDDLQSIVLSTLIDVFDHGLNHDGNDIDAEWSILNWALDKEYIKEMGWEALRSNDQELQLKGTLLIALGHFYRSTVYCLSDRRLIHANFEDYVSDWVRSVGVDNATITEKLSSFYPKSNVSGLSNGSSVWWHPASSEIV